MPFGSQTVLEAWSLLLKPPANQPTRCTLWLPGRVHVVRLFYLHSVAIHVSWICCRYILMCLRIQGQTPPAMSNPGSTRTESVQMDRRRPADMGRIAVGSWPAVLLVRELTCSWCCSFGHAVLGDGVLTASLCSQSTCSSKPLALRRHGSCCEPSQQIAHGVRSYSLKCFGSCSNRGWP